MRRGVRRAAAATALALLAACAALAPRPELRGTQFELAGRIAVRYDDQSSSGNIAWRHAASGDDLFITSPLGQGVARLVRTGEQVILTTAQGRTYRAPDAESLTAQVLGFRIPLRGLSDWVRGRPLPGAPAAASYFPDGRLRSLEQNGWTIHFLAYDKGLPSRLRLLYPGIDLRLAVSEWK